MHRHERTITTALSLLLLLPLAAGAQERDRWSWAGTIPQGRSIEIKGVNGEIRATPGSGSETRVVAAKTGREDDPAQVELRVVEHDGGITICAVYPAPRGRPANDCQPGARGRSNVSRNDVKVDFTVELPRGTSLVARTVNGAVSGTGLQSDLEVHTVNGDVRIATTGVATAETVNGSIHATLGRSDWRDGLSFETVNGGITVEFSGELNAVVSANTVNGSIDTDYPLTVQGRFGPRRMSGTVGSGGRQLELSTVNGGISILRR